MLFTRYFLYVDISAHDYKINRAQDIYKTQHKWKLETKSVGFIQTDLKIISHYYNRPSYGLMAHY